MKRRLRAVMVPVIVAALTIGLTPGVLAEPLTATKLIEACKTYQADQQDAQASSCRAFIHGYVSASTEIIVEDERPSAFVARAIRTRAGRLSDETEQRLSSRYCLPAGVTLDPLITKVAETPEPLADDATAESVLLAVLDRHYRCEAAAK